MKTKNVQETVIKDDPVHVGAKIMLKLDKSQILNQTANWVSFLPKPEIVKGHICFWCHSDEDSKEFGRMYREACRYGESMRDIGFYTNFKIFYVNTIMHLLPSDDLPSNWMDLLTEIDSSVIL